MDENRYYANLRDVNELEHHGILGQKWGVRRYQNEDGTLTEAGRKRQARIDKRNVKKANKYLSNTAYEQSQYNWSHAKSSGLDALLMGPSLESLFYTKKRLDKIIAKNNKKLSELNINTNDYKLVNKYLRQISSSGYRGYTVTTYYAPQYMKKR